MTVPARPADVGRLARAVTAAGLGGLGLLVAAPAAHAVTVPPGVYVVDEAGVLSTSDEQRLTQEIQDLRRDTGQGLYVVYVDEFSTDAQTLAQDVARQRGLGTNDSVLAIAVEDRAYGLDSGGDANLQNQVTRTYVGPELSRIGTDPGSADWLAAGTAAVQGLDDAADGTLDGRGASGAEYDPAGALPAGTTGGGSTAQGASGGGALTAVLGAGAVAAAVGGGVLVARSRKRTQGGAVERGRTEEVRRDPLDELSVEQLRSSGGLQARGGGRRHPFLGAGAGLR
nr:TPM domain-containing protein [Micrococcus luteus]